MARVKLITFDLDNTLWDANRVLYAAEVHMREWLDEHVPEYTTTMDRDAVMEIRTSLVEKSPHLAHDLSALRESVLFEGIRHCGYSVPEARTHAKAAFGKFFEARQQVILFDGVLGVLDTLAAGYRLGALTNGNADVKRIGLDRYFSFAYSSADVGMSKPAPDMFHAALETSHARPGESIHVGDHLIDDIKGAADVGMHTIWANYTQQIPRRDHPTPSAEVSGPKLLVSAVRQIDEG